MKKKLLTSAFLLCAFIISGFTINLSASDESNLLKLWTITASISNGGTMTPIGAVSVAQNTSQTFTFSPDECYEITLVTVDGNELAASEWAGNTYTFTNVQEDHTIEVVCSILRYTVTPSAGPNGTISPDQETVVDCGSVVTFTFAPDEGYVVDQVTVDGAVVTPTTATTHDVLVDQNRTINVTFKEEEVPIPTYTITPSAGANGTISPNTVQTVNEGDDAVFVVTPSDNYVVDSIIVTGSGTPVVKDLRIQQIKVAHSDTIFNVQENKEIRVVFALVDGIVYEEIPELSVYPNPTTGKVLLQSGDVAVSKVEVLNSEGKVVMVIDNPTDVLELSALSKGNYFLRFHSTKGLAYRQIIKN